MHHTRHPSTQIYVATINMSTLHIIIAVSIEPSHYNWSTPNNIVSFASFLCSFFIHKPVAPVIVCGCGWVGVLMCRRMGLVGELPCEAVMLPLLRFVCTVVNCLSALTALLTLLWCVILRE